VKLTWPLPALFAWSLGWGLFAALRAAQAPLALAIALGVATGAACSVAGSTPWRRVFIALGFPLSLAASGLASGVPPWGWLLPLALLALVYPLNAWRDAPLFPTPAGALFGLGQIAPLGADARVLDAGCGVGDGLCELRREYPQSALHGLEWSWPLRFVCAWRCRFARVRRGDIWAADWSGYELVYLFQRPESMARAADKAARELRPGAWLASLEFDVPGLAATKVLECADGRRVWLYRMPFRRRGEGARQGADGRTGKLGVTPMFAHANA
jgi:SAM-dependent methyltransferase